MTGPPWAAYLCLGASMALVGSYVGLSKLLLAVFPVFLLAGLRFGIGALAMLTGAAPAVKCRCRVTTGTCSFGKASRNFCFDLHAVRRDVELGRRGWSRWPPSQRCGHAVAPVPQRGAFPAAVRRSLRCGGYCRAGLGRGGRSQRPAASIGR
jgi:hypothetical protein